MKDLELKQNVLQEIMDLMDSRDGDRLKNHPKLKPAAVAVEIEKVPKEESEEEIEPKSEDPEMEEKDDEEEISPDMLQALLEKLKGHDE